MNEEKIIITGAKEKNLCNISVSISKNQITSVVGVSGSGKSALVFDTIAAESQRQLNETYSSFIRNRLPHYGKPRVEGIKNLPVSIVINQKRLGDNARSTVGTVTDSYSLLRLLFSRMGKPSAGSSDVFSFNHPQGMCKRCQGIGRIQSFRLDELLDKEKSLNEGAIRFPTFYPGGVRWKRYVCTGLFDNDKKIKDYTPDELDTLLYQSGFKPRRPTKDWPPTSVYEGIIPRITRTFLSKNCREVNRYQEDIKRVVDDKVCPDCSGGRLNQKALDSKIYGKSIADCSNMTITALIVFLKQIKRSDVEPVLEALIRQLTFAERVGLGYLTLNRQTATLSGGESQRIKMIRQLGSSLNGLLYIFDEPSVGLHPADLERINQLFMELRDKGNTLLLVEHDPAVIRISDQVLEMGPLSGMNGGNVIFTGNYDMFCSSSTLTAQYFSKRQRLKQSLRQAKGWYHIERASLFNLHEVSAAIPKGVMTVVTGVAGSGKSTLFNRVFPGLYPDCVRVDQTSVTVNRRSNIATFVDLFDEIRELFARENHRDPAWFSFNSKGACPDCKGLGSVELDLAFMESTEVVCETCGGKRFIPNVLSCAYHGKGISDVLNMSVEEALGFFESETAVGKLKQLDEVGLGYLNLGQPLTTLSGGELQRLKLAVELREPGPIYVLDEPTTGLHPRDIQILLKTFNRLVEAGSTLIIIEHNLDIMCQADWLIDMGPGAGEMGGRILFQGTPKELLKCSQSVTADYLKKVL